MNILINKFQQILYIFLTIKKNNLICFLYKYFKQRRKTFLMFKNKIINSLYFTRNLMLNLIDFLVLLWFHRFSWFLLHSHFYHH